MVVSAFIRNADVKMLNQILNKEKEKWKKEK